MPCIGRVASVGGMLFLVATDGTHLVMDIPRSVPVDARRFVEPRDRN